MELYQVLHTLGGNDTCWGGGGGGEGGEWGERNLDWIPDVVIYPLTEKWGSFASRVVASSV